MTLDPSSTGNIVIFWEGWSDMGGLELSEEYLHTVAQPSLERAFPDLYPRLAAGLIGNGSECFGFDDDISRDHDWGIDFYIWVSDEDRQAIEPLLEWKERLFQDTPPEFLTAHSSYGMPAAVMCTDDFYSQLIGVPGVPKTLGEWIKAPEENLALATNGKVFLDGTGSFTKIRTGLLGYVPESLRRKRIAAWCMAAAQTGQYNHLRMAKRQEWVVVRQTISRFTEAAMALVFLFNRRYRPYYKWTYRTLLTLPLLGKDVGDLLMHLACIEGLERTSIDAQHDDMEHICSLIVEELHRQHLSSTDDWFLTVHAEEVQASIEDDWLRNIPTQYQL